MVNVGSLPVVGNALFDLDTQAGITAVLLAVRASDLSITEKNEIRDIIFLYTNGGKDQSVRLGLEQKINAAGLVPVTPKKSETKSQEPKREPPTIGTFRSAPSFSVPVVPPVADVVAEPVPKPQAMPEPAPVVEPTPVSIPVVESVPAKATPLFSQQPVTPMPEVEPLHEEVQVPPVVMPKADQQQYLDRIREIKALVNEKVGNPVNLVDINNEVGREYMSALLDAMKRINSGMSADSAMVRLEAAYTAVEETLRTVSPGATTQQTMSVPVVSQAVPTEPAYATPAPVQEPMVVAPTPVQVPVYPTPTPEPVAQPVVVPVSSYQPAAPSAPVYQPLSQYQSPAESVLPPHQAPPDGVPHAVVPTPNYNQAMPVQSAAPQTFSSLADMVQQSHAQTGLPVTPVTAAPLQSGDPLLSSEVEEGLTQLLSEWSIFKKSGIFGTGPKGREHPLYKKMAELQIPLLLAGRFEGATQEVRQSLTDYMNGWRYEQGLIYEKGETFEHYLRRVIRHILDQNGR
jgi:hypothetical protein